MKPEEYHPHLRRILSSAAAAWMAIMLYFFTTLWFGMSGTPYQSWGELLLPQGSVEWFRWAQGVYAGLAAAVLLGLLGSYIPKLGRKPT